MNPESRFEVNEQLVAAKVMDGEAVIINLSTGSYYTSNQTAGAIWPLIEGRRAVAEIADALAARYQVARQRAEADIVALMSLLLAEEVIRPAEAAPSNAALGAAPEATQTYAAPALEVYRDMEQLLALDPPMPDVGEIPWRANASAPRLAPQRRAGDGPGDT